MENATISAKRRIIHIKKPSIFKKRNPLLYIRLQMSLDQIHTDLEMLIQKSHLVNDPKFLCRIAIGFKQLYHDTQKAKTCRDLKEKASQLEHTFSSPWEGPIGKMTLLDAIDSFSEQDPRNSDLKVWLCYFAIWGSSFKEQFFKRFSLS